MTTCEQDQHWMHRALDLARKGLGHVEPNPLVGCVLVKDHQLVASGWHQQFGGPHAEIHALQEAGSRAAGCTLYVTKEPCPMCAGAIVHCRLDRVVFGVADPKGGAAGGALNLLQFPSLNHNCDITAGVLEEDCRGLLQHFFQEKRSKLDAS